jgi:hypothetical protein
MSFRIKGLEPGQFRHVFELDENALVKSGMRSMLIDAPNSAPCRVSLCDVDPGERVVLLHYAHQTAFTPYRSAGPIFVSEGAKEAFDRIDELPQMFSNRPLSVRAYDKDGMIVDADVAHSDPRKLIDTFFSDSATDYIHVHLARRGCFACRVDRA